MNPLLDNPLTETVIHREVPITMTLGEVAAAFANMDSDHQAGFFSIVAWHVKRWEREGKGTFETQMQLVNESENLTQGGREIMQVIGDYSENIDALIPTTNLDMESKKA